MGYSHYYSDLDKFTDEEWNDFINISKKIFYYMDYSTIINDEKFEEMYNNPDSSDENFMYIRDDLFAITGVGWLIVPKEGLHFNYVKTYKRDYDDLIVAILYALVYIKPNVKFESDGNPEELQSGYDIFQAIISI